MYVFISFSLSLALCLIVYFFHCSAYMLILENDSNAEVRRAVLSCIAMSPRTLPKVLKRTRDIKENVRKLAYQVSTNTVKWSCINLCAHMHSTSTDNNIIKLLSWHNWILVLVKRFELRFELSIFCFLFWRFWLTKFTLKLWPSHRELIYCSRASMTPQVIMISVPVYIFTLSASKKILLKHFVSINCLFQL